MSKGLATAKSGLAALALAAAADAAPLGPPLACTPDAACYLQNLPDVDPGPDYRDPACGARTYDGHDGIDLRVRSAAMRAGVAVLSPVAGTVLRVRDGEPDGVARTANASALAGRECGNGIVIRADDGDEIQLCHLRQGSVRVAPDARVGMGDVIGLVGQSGRAQFPHVHLSLRRDGARIDPTTGSALARTPPQPGAAPACRPGLALAGPDALWSAQARAALPFDVRTRIVDWGFIADAPEAAQRADLAPSHDGSRTAPALVFFAFFGGPATGDEMRVRLLAPGGAVLAQSSDVQARDQAQAARYVGKKTPAGGWPAGRYVGEAVLFRAGREVERRVATIDLR